MNGKGRRREGRSEREGKEEEGEGRGGGGKGRENGGRRWRRENEGGEGREDNLKVTCTCLSFQQPYSITAQGMVPTKTRFDPVYASVLNPEPYNDILVPPAMLPHWGVTQFIAVSKYFIPKKLILTSTIISFIVILIDICTLHSSPILH